MLRRGTSANSHFKCGKVAGTLDFGFRKCGGHVLFKERKPHLTGSKSPKNPTKGVYPILAGAGILGLQEKHILTLKSHALANSVVSYARGRRRLVHDTFS